MAGTGVASNQLFAGLVSPAGPSELNVKRFANVVQEICDDLDRISKRLREAAAEVCPNQLDRPACET